MRLWDSCFAEELTDEALEYTQTVEIDQRLARSDIFGSIAHTLMLCRQGIVQCGDGRLIVGCLLGLLGQAIEGKLQLRKDCEDIHLNVETMLIEEVGPEVGGRLHTARSRNDQVVTDTRMLLRESILRISLEVLALIALLAERARGETQTLLLGRTHSQPAQPISYAYWLSGHASVFLRDAARLLRSYEVVNLNPLGSCALAGSSFPIDRHLTTRLLAFDGLVLHGLDATSSRDFVLEVLSVLAIFMSHVSRLSEEIVVWSGFEHGFLKGDDGLATGSSIMPQKRNPVVAELARARAGDVYGALVHVLTIVKGVAMGYSCDLQEDKPPLWRALDVTASSAAILRSQISRLRLREHRVHQLCVESFASSTELANFLVTEHGLPFRQAYRVTGAVIRAMESEGKSFVDIADLALKLRAYDISIAADLLSEILDPLQAMRRQRSLGGTAPERVEEILAEIRAEHDRLHAIATARLSALEQRLERTQEAASRFASGEDFSSISLPTSAM